MGIVAPTSPSSGDSVTCDASSTVTGCPTGDFAVKTNVVYEAGKTLISSMHFKNPVTDSQDLFFNYEPGTHKLTWLERVAGGR